MKDACGYLVMVMALAFSALMLTGRSLMKQRPRTNILRAVGTSSPGGREGADQLARKTAVLMEKVLKVPFRDRCSRGHGRTGITKCWPHRHGQSIAVIADSHAVPNVSASWKMITSCRSPG